MEDNITGIQWYLVRRSMPTNKGKERIYYECGQSAVPKLYTKGTANSKVKYLLKHNVIAEMIPVTLVF